MSNDFFQYLLQLYISYVRFIIRRIENKHRKAEFMKYER